ncbi:MAG TPA: ABC transporter ATP-binding protein [Mycobacteriales bacterium]|nr:ABC transporter ATP-binding protein [Mycobacteriales bacterium]
MKPARFVARLAWITPARYVWGSLLWAVVTVLPLGSGLVLQQVFDRISGGRIADLSEPLWLCAAFVGVELVRGIWQIAAHVYGDYWWNAGVTVLRSNVLRSLLTARGPAASRLPHSPGEAISRLRDDADDLTGITDATVPLFGATLFGIGAVVVMALIDPLITLVLVLPMIAVGVASRAMGSRIRRLHRRARAQAAAVTAHLGDVFGAVLAIKTAGAEDAALQRLRSYNRRRRDVAIKDRLATDLLDTTTAASVEISIGLVLLLAAPAMRRGDFTVGDLALFTSYVSWLTLLPTVIGEMVYRLPQAEVAIGRLARLLAEHESAEDLPRNHGLWLKHDPPPLVPHRPVDPLQVLEARGLTVRYGERGAGVRDVDLVLPRGSFTVITGAVGSGKSTLVRALLGLLPLQGGRISWNGRAVEDPGTFLVPGRAAYAGQVPRLFSESLGENLLLGADATDLQRAVRLAAFEEDLAAMPEGLATVVGSRGVRLSGGQVQRATAARALVRSPELLVVDDVSSALDVPTENLLWERIAQDQRTVLVVSHRRAALERADQIIVLDRGRVVGRGGLAELLRECPEMRRLWSEEVVEEASGAVRSQ